MKKKSQINITAGKKLLQIRKQLNYTQSQFAQASGYDRSFISHLENGNKPFDLDKLVHFSDVINKINSKYKITPHYFLSDF